MTYRRYIIHFMLVKWTVKWFINQINMACCRIVLIDRQNTYSICFGMVPLKNCYSHKKFSKRIKYGEIFTLLKFFFFCSSLVFVDFSFFFLLHEKKIFSICCREKHERSAWNWPSKEKKILFFSSLPSQSISIYIFPFFYSSEK